ncbi:hypothetical protein C4569_01600 [Candidatus Parcubacteria bacterium]|nr:MAG: hypothetical protein C4569_01600 [Candidatus Parcubacteria bacterium]
MKKLLFTAALLFIGLVVSGCTLLKDNNNGQQNKADRIVSAQDEITQAQEALITFFKYLSRQDFESALTLFEPDEENSWEWIANFTIEEDRNNKAEVLKNYCEAVGTCLEVKIIEAKKEVDDVYNLVVQFQKPDGGVFVLGPCCGATEEEMPPQNKFNFTVKKINSVFKVTTAPVYRP